ncbi:hypothetical protein SCP_0802610 [Sparassis crispa]|uniref:HAT C-terminal dimerisation domain-containing protein n=1 Tax=Sparassis crispa TaxID=139825 RepID=A0A401GU83_9APHY|nr:hypothetical protein SCP_0802610 [Sparassis crispa]GBE85739.1 hypothetical protein SCP_0802610 [Sparassis crispa]
MARQKSWLWEHYYQDEDKVNSSFFEARCMYCAVVKLKEIQLLEEKAVAEGKLMVVWSKNILLQEAQKKVKMATGKISVLVNHLITCEYAPKNVKDKVKKYKKKKSKVADMDKDSDSDSDVAQPPSLQPGICLMLGDYYKHNPQVKTVVDAALKVIKWFNNHSFALGVLNEEQQLMYHKILALILPVITRWTSHFCSLLCLLETWKALQITSIKHDVKLIESAGRSVKSKRKAKRVLQHVRNDEWWKKLVIVKMHIEPLVITTNVSQGANTRCDQVLLLLGNLYRSYFNIRKNDRTIPDAEEEDEAHPVTAIMESIEKRWQKADQDLFITCLFLNPFINSSLLNGTTLSVAMIMGIIHRLYLRVFRTETPPEDLMRSVYEYHMRFGMFFAENWPLNDLKEGLKDEDGTCDPLRVWRILDKKNSLVKLADLILSFVPSSATTERLFTKMDDTKTKKCS